MTVALSADPRRASSASATFGAARRSSLAGDWMNDTGDSAETTNVIFELQAQIRAMEGQLAMAQVDQRELAMARVDQKELRGLRELVRGLQEAEQQQLAVQRKSWLSSFMDNLCTAPEQRG